MSQDTREFKSRPHRTYYYVYVLKSLKDSKLYTGWTSNLGRRLKEHKTGKTKSLRNRRPLKLVYFEKYKTKAEAFRRERYFKTPEGGVLKRKLIDGGVGSGRRPPQPGG